MKIQKLRLTEFRNFKTKLLEFSDGITIILGPNASGKTNILESLYLLSTGKSFKAKVVITAKTLRKSLITSSSAQSEQSH